MSIKSNFEVMAEYNRWMNKNIYRATSSLNPEDIKKECGAFFGSVFGTLNHILVGDLIWLKRIACHPDAALSLADLNEWPRPEKLNTLLHSDFKSLTEARVQLDDIIIRFIGSVDCLFFSSVLTYSNIKGEVSTKNMGHILQHLFNHQTHHRGQSSTLLAQLGVDVGVTDLIMCVPDVELQ